MGRSVDEKAGPLQKVLAYANPGIPGTPQPVILLAAMIAYCLSWLCGKMGIDNPGGVLALSLGLGTALWAALSAFTNARDSKKKIEKAETIAPSITTIPSGAKTTVNLTVEHAGEDNQPQTLTVTKVVP